MKFLHILITALGVLFGMSTHAAAQTSGVYNLTASSAACAEFRGCAVLALSPTSTSIRVSITGTHNTTLVPEFSVDGGATWSTWTLFNLSSASYGSSTTSVTTTTNGNYLAPNHLFTHVRIRPSAYTSGTAVVSISAVDAPTVTSIDFGGGSATIGTVNQGTASGSESWLVHCDNCGGGTTDTDDGTIAGAQTVGLVGAITYVYNGSNNIRVTGDATNGLDVDVTRLPTLANVTTVGTVSSVTAIANALPAGNNNIGDFDVASIVSGTGATNLGKAEDAAHSSGDVGVMALTVRKDTAAATAGTDGDYQPPISDASGAMWVNCLAGCSGGTQYAEDAAHVSGNTGTMGLAVRVDADGSALAGTTGDYAPLEVDDFGALRAMIQKADGTAASFATDVSDDAAANASGPQVMGICDDTATDGVDEGDAGRLRIDCSSHALIVKQDGWTQKRYITVGSSDNEIQIKATPGVLHGLSARNSHASTTAYIKCTNLTAANTTPGSSAVFYEMIVPAAGGVVDRDIDITFDTALTCYVVTGKTDADATDAAADDVSFNLSYK